MNISKELNAEEYESIRNDHKYAIRAAEGPVLNIINDMENSSPWKVVHSHCSRIKELSSLNEKITRKIEKGYTPNKIKIDDIAGFRIVCVYKDDLERLSSLIDSAFPVIETCDYLNQPKENGYRGIHKIISIKITVNGCQKYTTAEIQIRSATQDAFWSQEHARYKMQGDCDPKVMEEIRNIADNLDRNEDWMIQVRDQLYKQKPAT